MLRIPQPKEQARILKDALSELGVTLGHQKLLDVVARLHGHKDWNVMSASQNDIVEASKDIAPVSLVLRAAVETLMASADDTGCSDDLTVVSKAALTAVECALTDTSTPPVPATPAYESVWGWSIGDVLSLRPDLTDDEAYDVLLTAKRRFDAEVGINWTVLSIHADGYPRRCVKARVMAIEGMPLAESFEVVLNLSDGAFTTDSPLWPRSTLLHDVLLAFDLRPDKEGTPFEVVVPVYCGEYGKEDGLNDFANALYKAGVPTLSL